MRTDRRSNTIRNFLYGAGSHVLDILLSFATRTIFIKLLASDYLGVNGLFSNILSILSLAELGAGGAFLSMLYKPLAEHNETMVASIMRVYRRTYLAIACFVGVVGAALTPFLPYLVKENTIENIETIYLLYIANMVITYLCADRLDLIRADQKSYIITVISQIFIILQYALQIGLLLLTHSFLVYLLVQIGCAIARRVVTVIVARKLYPYLRKPGILSHDDKKSVFERIRGGICGQFGYVIATGTDSIVISRFLGLATVGIYSNYLLIIGVIQKITTIFFASMRASIGNRAVTSTPEQNYKLFKKQYFFNWILIGFCSICLIVLMNPFINLWIGEAYLLDMPLVILAVLIFAMSKYGIRSPVFTFRNTFGLFFNDRYFSLLEGFANLGLSLALVNYIGLAGVFLGTVISSMITFTSGSVLIYKKVFEKPYWYFLRDTAIYIAVFTGIGAATYFLSHLIPASNWLLFALQTITCGVVAAGLLTLCFYRTEEFRYVVGFIADFFKRLRRQHRLQ